MELESNRIMFEQTLAQMAAVFPIMSKVTNNKTNSKIL